MGNNKNHEPKRKKRGAINKLSKIPLKSFACSGVLLILAILVFSYPIKEISDDTTKRITVVGHNFDLYTERGFRGRPGRADLFFEADGQKYYVHYGQAEYTKYFAQIQHLIHTDNPELTVMIPSDSFLKSEMIEVFDLRSVNCVYYDVSDAQYRVSEARCVVTIIGLVFVVLYLSHAFLVLCAYGVVELKRKRHHKNI